MKDGALSHYYWSPGRLDYAKAAAPKMPGAGNPTRKESFLQLSHRSRALALCPLWRQCREKRRFARQQKNTHGQPLETVRRCYPAAQQGE